MVLFLFTPEAVTNGVNVNKSFTEGKKRFLTVNKIPWTLGVKKCYLPIYFFFRAL